MLTTYKPRYEDLWFKQLMLADGETMSYNHACGGTIHLSQEQWRNWYSRWLVNDENKRYYRYIKNDLNEFVGEISYHYDSENHIYLSDVLIYSKYRKKGLGHEALDTLCSIAKERGIKVLYDEIAIDNFSVSLFLKHGFSEVSRTENTIRLKKIL